MLKFRNDNRDRASGSMSQGSLNNGSTNPLFQKYGRNHQGICRASSDVCFRCGKQGQKIREFSIGMWKGSNDCQQAQTNSSIVPAGRPTQQGATFSTLIG